MPSPPARGRPLAFSPDRVTARMMATFWAHGLGGTTFRHLERATGLSRSSLYNTFGPKRELQRRALDHYLARLGEAMIAPAVDGEAGLDDLHGFLDRLGRGVHVVLGAPPPAKGCMMINAMVEEGGRNPMVRAQARGFFAKFRAAMAIVLHRSAAMGEIDPRDSPAIAAQLLSVALGVNVAIRAGIPQGDIRNMIDSAHRQLDAWRCAPPRGRRARRRARA